jgi:predicted ester cyclase
LPITEDQMSTTTTTDPDAPIDLDVVPADASPGLRAAYAVFDAIRTGDLSCIDDVVTDDFVDHGSPVPIPPGPAGYRQILGFVTRVLQIRYTVQHVAEAGDRIYIRAVADGTGVAEVHGPGTVGKPYRMQTLHEYRVVGDRLAEHWGVRDELGVLIQLGAVPPPGVELP